MDKSEILPTGRVDNLEELALELGCKVGMLSSSYLLLPLGAPHKSTAAWDGGGEVSEETSFMEETIYIQRRGTHSHSKYFV